MRKCVILVAAGLLAGCAPTVALRNSTTGETVACGSYTFVGFGEHDTLTPAEQRCVD